MVHFSSILYTGIYNILIDHLGLDDVLELTLINKDWKLLLGDMNQKYWYKVAIQKFGLRVEFLVFNKQINWYSYFRCLNYSYLCKFLQNQNKYNEILLNSLKDVIVEHSRMCGFSFVQEQDYTFKDILYCKQESYLEETNTINNRCIDENLLYRKLKRIELDLGGLGNGYIWNMEVLSITSQNITLKAECIQSRIPNWEMGQIIMGYIAVWGVVNEDNYILLYHHKNPFHNYLINTENINSSNLYGMKYFMSPISVFAGLQIILEKSEDKITFLITLHTTQIIETIYDYMTSIQTQNNRYCDSSVLLYFSDYSEYMKNINEIQYKFSTDISNKHIKSININHPNITKNETPLFLQETNSLYIQLQIMDQRYNPQYIYGILKCKHISSNFTHLEAYINLNKQSNIIDMTQFYDIGVAIIDSSNGETVLGIIFPKMCSYYNKKYKKSKKVVILYSFSRLYGTHVPIIDPPCFLTCKPNSILTRLEVIILPKKNKFGRIAKVKISLNIQECKALLSYKRFKRIIGLSYNSQVNLLNNRKPNSPKKFIEKKN
ncbi:uncharacterized protein CMU_028050 [Cryptosporidium muris RN66]|uniref:F-box domain-containing protein n=1 Tax=Cryptosporidium muris (strain RN66) TaxID=441375 RepID=B6ABP3_CRYMR|nr:uncharacterized protein CMU_028050 [Cryptosporidium muris RN66]EEA05795.1 hypothetical protein, conserved [Cryptosporidium muris RN66]|eukprot:XP_002140144.1 hypothetical protein [Cryptosporidium muris RN66]